MFYQKYWKAETMKTEKEIKERIKELKSFIKIAKVDFKDSPTLLNMEIEGYEGQIMALNWVLNKQKKED